MFNIETVPFSRYGSYFAVSKVNDDIFLRDLHGGDESPSNLFKLHFFYEDLQVSPVIQAEETILTFSYQNSRVRICFFSENCVNIETDGLCLKISFIKNRYDSLIQLDDDHYHYDFYTKEIKYLFHKIKGNICFNAPWKYVGNEFIEILMDGQSYLSIEEFKTVLEKPKAMPCFETCHEMVQTEYKAFFRSYTCDFKEITQEVQLAVYIMWSCVVHPNKNIREYSVYMSKNCMQNIWSWDNAFNAISLSKHFPALSFAQLTLFFHFQDDSGAFPDFINNHFISFNCVKPPVHSWAFSIMRKNNPFFNDPAILKKVYHHLKKQGDFWLQHRDLKHQFLPVYFHGNDSGWDNASIFRDKLPVIAPDLLCHLIRHFDIMAQWAKELGYEEDATQWKANGDRLFENLMRDFYVDGQFVARTLEGYEIIPNKDSLILFLPLILHERLGAEIVEKLIHRLEKDFLTSFGLSTESLNSPFYKEDGYWLGPIWPAPTFLIIDALENSPFHPFAADLAKRFLKLVRTGQMAENFNGLTGQGLSDKAFTWTSGVYLTLLQRGYHLEGF